MAIPSGSGTEVLKRNKWAGFDHSADIKIIDGEALHIYTVLSLIVHNTTSTATGLAMYIFPDATSGNIVEILSPDATIIPSKGTFVFSDKLVLTGTDELIVAAGSGGGGNLDAWITYIDQNWED